VENLRSSAKQIVMVVHANHANELSHEVKAACQRMTEQGITLLNQSVLLQGVNDNPESLCALSEKLFSFKILPYYLHLLDKANGVGHFAVAEATALALHQQMRIRLPGYLVPRLVNEQAGAAYKIPLFDR
jgi:L-lysine 2,3-aminomutase